MTISKHRMDKCCVLILVLDSYDAVIPDHITVCCSRKMWIVIPVFIPQVIFNQIFF